MATQSQITPQQLTALNAQARANILAYGVPRLQQIYSQGVVPANGNILNIPFQNVGLIRGFLVKVTGTITNTSTTGGTNLTATRSELGGANVLSGIQVQDYNNNTRIQTTGWHISLLNSAKQNMVFGGAYAPNVPVDFGNNWTVQAAAATIAPNSGGTANSAISYYYYVPLAYSKLDLRGAVYGGLVNATAQLILTINPTPVVAAGADATLAVYGGTTGGWTGNVTVTVWQDYIDQLPLNQQGQVVLPPIDISTIYDLKNTSNGAALTVGQDFPIPYANFRTFLSTCVIFDNGGSLNVGSDVNYWMLQAANSTTFWKYGPNEAALLARSIFMADPPKGVYWFDTRDRPINTQQFGNVQLVINPSTVNANPALLVGYEQFDMTQTIGLASSLPAGG
jgi:hypothetical protein